MFTSKRKRIEQLEDTVAQLTEATVSLKNTIIALNKKVGNLKACINKLTGQLEASRAVNVRLQHENRKLTKKLNTQKKEVVE